MAACNHKYDNGLKTLPLIDISCLRRADTDNIKKIADELGRAARDFGFFRVIHHGIDLDLVEATYRMAEQFFALPDSEKHRYYIGLSKNHRGYVPFSEKGDYEDEVHRNYEAFDLGLDLPETDPDFLAGKLIVGPNVWPDLTGFKETVSRYYSEISSLGNLICSALELHLGLPSGALTNQMSKPVSQLRLLHYVRANETTDHKSINMGAHTDYECLTLLHTRNEGLQVLTQDNQWIDVPADHAAYVVNIGDMLEAWSNGLLRSTPHRVLNLRPERFSLPYFVAANHDAEIRPFEQLIGPDGYAKYEAFEAGAHLERMLLRDFPYLRARQRRVTLKSEGSIEERVLNPFEKRIKRSSV